MTKTRERRYIPDDSQRAFGLAIGGFGPLLVAGLLVPFRTDSVVAANVALVFVIVVVLAAAVGGRTAGVVGAVVSTLSFDFFFTRPFQSLKIDNGDDIGTAVLLLLISLIVAQLVGFAQRSRTRSDRSYEDTIRVHRVAELVAGGAPIDAVVAAVDTEITALLSLRDCRYEPGAPVADASPQGLPEIGRLGALAAGNRRYVGNELALPDEGAFIRVLGRGHELGRIVLEPGIGVGVSIDQCRIAVAITDQLGAALAADAPHTASS